MDNSRPQKRFFIGLVKNHYNKIIYRITDDVIEIVDFGDTRREAKEQAAILY